MAAKVVSAVARAERGGHVASISKIGGGPKRALWSSVTGRRKSVRLGAMSNADARRLCDHANELEQAIKLARPPSVETSAWLDALPASTQNKLAAVGLVQQRPKQSPSDLLGFSIHYMQSRRHDWKPATRESFRLSQQKLLAHFGESARIEDVGASEARLWKMALLDTGLAESTARQHVRNVKAMFGAAIADGLIDKNPFAKVASTAISSETKTYVPAAWVDRLMDHLPSDGWRTLIALARFGGLRVPSESGILTWECVDQERKRLHVHAPKLERRGQPRIRASRTVPITPELARWLTPPAKHGKDDRVVVIPGTNPHMVLRRAIERAGLTQWPKAFQSLRRSCEVDWARDYPQAVVSEWMGHGIQVSAEHYISAPDDLLDKAAGLQKVQQIVQREDGSLFDLLVRSVRSTIEMMLKRPAILDVLGISGLDRGSVKQALHRISSPAPSTAQPPHHVAGSRGRLVDHTPLVLGVSHGEVIGLSPGGSCGPGLPGDEIVLQIRTRMG